MTRKDFTDEELTAFLDGEATAELKAEIEAAVEGDSALKDRIVALTIPMAPMKAAFDAQLGAAPVMEPLPVGNAAQVGVSTMKMLGGMAASLVVGALLGMSLLRGDDAPRDWQDYAAAYHALYVNGTLAGVEASPEQTAQDLAELGAVLSHDLASAQRDPVLDYKRGQVLGYEGKPLVQLAYLSPMGDPVALCLVRTDQADAAIAMTELEGLAAAQWQSDGVAYLLIGGTDATLIKDAAVRFADAL